MERERSYDEIAKEIAEYNYALEHIVDFQKIYNVLVCKQHEDIDCHICKAEADKWADENVAKKKFFKEIVLVDQDDFVQVLKRFAGVYPDSWPFLKDSIEYVKKKIIKKWGPEKDENRSQTGE